jgi:hypothetical protein
MYGCANYESWVAQLFLRTDPAYVQELTAGAVETTSDWESATAKLADDLRSWAAHELLPVGPTLASSRPVDPGAIDWTALAAECLHTA